MVKIRLRRMGAKKAPFYRVVVADSRFARDDRGQELPVCGVVHAEPALGHVDHADEFTHMVASLFTNYYGVLFYDSIYCLAYLTKRVIYVKNK